MEVFCETTFAFVTSKYWYYRSVTIEITLCITDYKRNVVIE